jgi:hypothetical protein
MPWKNCLLASCNLSGSGGGGLSYPLMIEQDIKDKRDRVDILHVLKYAVIKYMYLYLNKSAVRWQEGSHVQALSGQPFHLIRYSSSFPK